MPSRVVVIVLAFMVCAATAQQPVQERIEKKIAWHEQMASEADKPPSVNKSAARLDMLHHDIEQLSALSVTVQYDLQQLQKGALAKDLDEQLKKLEKLSKKLRRDIQP